MHPSPPKPSVTDTGFDFELTDFAEARSVLDSESLSPAAEAARAVDKEYWVKHRRPRVATDRALTGEALEWLIHLPASLRPDLLSEQMPRLANQIAAAWPHPDECLAALNRLLDDGRIDRRGFSLPLRGEIETLRDHLRGAGRSPAPGQR